MKNTNNDLLYKIAITQIPEIGPIIAKQLVSYAGSALDVFKYNKSKLEKIPGVGAFRADAILKHKDAALIRADEELKFVEKNQLECLWYLDALYPKRLLHCNDAPLLLYYKGNCNLNAERILAVVGTRKITDYGKGFIENFMQELSVYNPVIISGLAFGVDIVSHKNAIKNNLATVGVVANGFNKMYPAEHKKTITEMCANGGVLTEYVSNTIADRENFPQRNRIVAGMSDATILIETAKKGGAIITAMLANGYNRDVFALPGRYNDTYSAGCNHLIKTNIAQVFESAEDIAFALGWDLQTVTKKEKIQKQLFVELSIIEQKIVDYMHTQTQVETDNLCYDLQLTQSQVASAMLTLELYGIVKALPGKVFKLM